MIVCKECKQSIKDENYYFLDAINAYLCSDQCRISFAKKEQEKEDKKVLYDTICRIFKVNFPVAQQLADVKRLKEKEGFTYKQMSSILHYVYDVKGFAPYGYSLYQIPSYKEEAKKWYLENEERLKRAREMAAKEPVVIKRVEKVNVSRNKKRGFLQLNPEDV